MAKLELFWDVGSPYTYLAITQVEGLKQRTGAEVELRPFLLGGVFKGAGNTMPAAVPSKAAYMMQDLRRWSDHYGVPLRLPPNDVPFPINSLLPMRAAVAAMIRGSGDAFCHGVFRAYWAEGRDVSIPDEVAKVAAAIGLEGKALLDAASTQEVKDKLRSNTEEALTRGAFGAPAMFIGEDLYWGNDRLMLVEKRLMRGG